MRTPSVVGWALVAALAGCGAESPDLAAMKIELNALKHELEYLREQTEDLDPRLRTAEQMALQSIDERDSPLVLDCEEGKPGVVVTRLAPVTVVCEGIEHVEGGDRIRLRLGNPTSGRLDGVYLTLYTGDGAERGRSDTRVHVRATASLPPGAWKTVEVDVPPSNEPVLRDVSVRAQVDAIALAQR